MHACKRGGFAYMGWDMCEKEKELTIKIISKGGSRKVIGACPRHPPSSAKIFFEVVSSSKAGSIPSRPRPRLPPFSVWSSTLPPSLPLLIPCTLSSPFHTFASLPFPPSTPKTLNSGLPDSRIGVLSLSPPLSNLLAATDETLA